MPCSCCVGGCATNEDCGCLTGGYTYYAGLDALYPGQGCCPPGTYFDESIGGCWAGEPGTEAANDTSFFCCDGVCLETPCICPCTCSKRGYSYAYTELNGCEMCCPPGYTWDGEVCDDGGGGWVSANSYEGWTNCGDFCVEIPSECPP